MYNTTNFGQGFESTTNVMTIRGYDAQSCASTTAFPALRQVQSAHWLGNPQKEVSGLVIYSEPNFLGSRFSVPPPDLVPGDTPTPLKGDVTAIRLGSLAITGLGKWRLCADAMCLTAICIDVGKYRGQLYLNRNVITDTSAAWPGYVRAYVYNPTDTSVCDSDGSPPLPVIKSLVAGNGEKGKLEIF